MTAEPLTAAEQERVARFDAAPPAEESAVERVARAIYNDGAYCGDCPYESWEYCSECQRVCRSYARCAITAMRPAPDTAKADEGVPVYVNSERVKPRIGDVVRSDLEGSSWTWTYREDGWHDTQRGDLLHEGLHGFPLRLLVDGQTGWAAS